MKTFTAVVERCPDTGLYVGYVPGFPGAHTQAETLDELNRNLQEVIGMLLEEGEPTLEAVCRNANRNHKLSMGKTPVLKPRESHH
jgi:predicted RNase H-like HicB family nuclease